MDLKKMQNLSEKQIARFIKAATELVMDEVTNTDEDNKNTIIKFTARDMAIGAAMKRSEHVLTGVGIGVLGTTLAFTIGNKIKKNKDEDRLDKVKEVIKEHKDIFKEKSTSKSEVTEDEQVDEEEVEEEEQSIIDKVNDILKKPQNLDDLKAVIAELRKTEK